MLKKIFTKEVLINGAITFGVVLGALVVYDKFIATRANGGSQLATTPTPPAVAPSLDGEA